MKKTILFLALALVISSSVFADSSLPLNFRVMNGYASIRLDTVGTPNSVNLEYSTDSCASWNTYTIGDEIYLTSAFPVVFFKAQSTNSTLGTAYNDYYKFVITDSVAADGNIMSLLDETMTVTTVPAFCFTGLFWGCTTLVQAPELPATTLGVGCCQNMFNGCSSLAQAPRLPAMNLGGACYQNMFIDCTSLTQAPALPATTLADACYLGMFLNCNRLLSAPALPATVMEENCYQNMFTWCESLRQAPALPATTLADACYLGMFLYCRALTLAPALRATTLADKCYMEMFSECSSLTQLPDLLADSLPVDCYNSMFNGCSSLVLNEDAPGKEWSIPATYVGENSLKDMFTGTAGTMNGTPMENITYYTSPFVECDDTTEADVYFLCEKMVDTVAVTEYHLVLYKVGGNDTADVYFSNDTSFVISRKPRVIVIVDSVTGTTTTVVITIDRTTPLVNIDEITVHMEHLDANSTYVLILTPLGAAGSELGSQAISFDTNNPEVTDVEDCVAEKEVLFPTEETDVYLMDGRYVGKYSEGLPRGVYVMREGRRCWKMAVGNRR